MVSPNKLVAEPGYHSPDHMVWLLGHANKAMAVVEGVEMMALVETGSKVFTPTERFSTEMSLRILPLGGFDRGCVVSQGDQVILILYRGYIEAKLNIPDLPCYNEDV